MIYAINGVTPRIAASAFLAPSAEVIGDVIIGEGSSLWFSVVVRGDVNRITIGRDTNIQDGTMIHGTYRKHSVTIGDGVSVGHAAMLHGCTIGNSVLVGMRATILDGAVIGDECLIGAGALVTQNMVVPPRSLVLGAPAKVVRPLTSAEVAGLHDSTARYKMYVGWYADPNFKEVKRG